MRARSSGIDLGPDSEPALETGRCLVQQHAEAVDDPQAPRLGVGQKRGLERHIDDIGDDRVRPDRREIEAERGLARHAERGGVDDEPHLPGRPGQILERDGPKRARATRSLRRVDGEIADHLVRLAGGPVGHADRADPALLQPGDHGPGGPARADHQGCPDGPLPAGAEGVVEMGREPRDVRVVAEEDAVLDPEGVDRTEALGPGRAAVDTCEGRFLVGDRHVPAGEALVGEIFQEAGKILRRHRDPLIGSGEAVLFQPVAVDERRAGMLDRVADHEGFRHDVWSHGIVRRLLTGSPTVSSPML